MDVDLVVVGSGGGLAGAIAARRRGLEVLVVEKTEHLGGSTAISGGTWWAPATGTLAAAGVDDSVDAALRYLDAVVGDAGPATSPQRKRAYVTGGQRLHDELLAAGLRLGHCTGWPDYYAERDGGVAAGRTLYGRPFDLAELGPVRTWLRPTKLFLAANSHEVAALAKGKRSVPTALLSARVLARSGLARVRRRQLVTRGQSLVGQLLAIAIREGVQFWRSSPVVELVGDGRRVSGVVVERGGRSVVVRARAGVLLAAGGFARDPELRHRHQGRVGAEWTMANPGDTGELLQAAIALGAATDLLDEAWWVPGSVTPDGPMLHVWDRCFPHSLIVDGNGDRYMNEAAPYMEAGQAMLARDREAPAVPSWIILEHRHRQRYSWGLAPPGITPSAWRTSGYARIADSIDDLARQCALDPARLRLTIERFNGYARAGVDADFHRGETAIEHYYGDPRQRPNPCLGEVVQPPFYAFQLFPGDVGTAGGLLSDEHGRVLDGAGVPIAGLYAAGNTTASVMGRTYPAAGASIGASLVFSYLAALHATGAADAR